MVDAIDVLGVGACLVEGNLTVPPAAWVGGGALVFLGIGVWGWRRLQGEKAGGEKGVQIL